MVASIYRNYNLLQSSTSTLENEHQGSNSPAMQVQSHS